jgi:hypothetical protein
MKKIKLLSVIGIVFFLTSTFTGCKKKGCTDKNSDYYDPKAEKSDDHCVFRYSSGIKITPPIGIYLPNDGGSLFVKFAKKSSSNWDYVSSLGADSSLVSLTVPLVMFTNEDWKFELYEHDGTDLLISGTFNPLTQGSNGSIILTFDKKIITFKYIIK